MVENQEIIGPTFQIEDIKFIPIINTMIAGGVSENHGGNGGAGAYLSPKALLVIKEGQVSLLKIKNTDSEELKEKLPEVLGKVADFKD